MDTDDQQSSPLSQLGVLPAFSIPTPTPDPDPSPSTGPDPQTAPETTPRRRNLLDAVGGRSGPEPPRSRWADEEVPTPTVISSASKPTATETTKLIVGLLSLLGLGAAMVIRWRMRHTLRQPTSQQKTDIAAPLAAIALRHANIDWLNKDLADGLAAATAAGAYATDGPLLIPIYPEVDVPGDLQEAPQ